MVMANTLGLVLLVPLIFIPIVYLLGKQTGKETGLWTALPLTISLLLLATVAMDIQGGGEVVEYYSWASSAGLTFGLKADGLSIWVLLTINLLCLGISIYSVPYMEHRLQEWEHETGEHLGNQAYSMYYALYLLYAIGMLGTAMATNTIQFYFFYELMLLPSWALINNYGYGEREYIGMMYFLWTHVGAVIMLAGLLTSYWITGSFEISALSALVGHTHVGWIAFAILIGFFTKMAVFGVHVWLPYAHGEAPTPISALLSPAMIGIGSYAAIRLVAVPMAPIFATFSMVFTIWALLTMVYGGLMALAQDDIKRFLAYSSISQMGYIFLGLASAAAYGEAGAIFHYVSHGFGKCILFGVAGILITHTGTRSIKKMGGLINKMPWTAALALIGFFVIGGMPPTIGFISKFMIFSGVFDTALANPAQLAVAVVATIMTALTLGYSLYILHRVFYGPLAEGMSEVKEAEFQYLLPMAVLALIAVIIGIYPSLVTDYLVPFFFGLQ